MSINTVKKVFSDATFSSGRTIISVSRGIVVIPLITKFLGESSYGVWVTVIAITGLISSIGGLHLHGSLIRYSSQHRKSNQVFSDVLCLSMTVGIVLAFTTFATGNYIDLSGIFEEQIPNKSNLVTAASLIVLSKLLFTINVNFPRAKGYVKTYDSVLMVRDLSETVILLVVFFAGGGITAALMGLAGFGVFLNAIIILYAIARFDIPLPDPSNFGQYFRYGIPMVPKGISSKLLRDTDKYLLLYFVGPSAVGIYAVAKGISSPIIKFTKIFNPTLYPTISKAWDKRNFQEIEQVYTTIFRFYSILAIPSMAGLVLLAESLLTVISTDIIAQEAKYVVPLFTLGFVLKGYDNSIRYVLTAAERTDLIGGSVVAGVLLNVVMNLLLIPKFDIFGAGTATLASQAFLFSIILHYVSDEIAIDFPWKTIARSIFATILMSILVTLVSNYLTATLRIIIIPGIGAIIYFLTLYLVGEFSEGELRNIKTYIPEFR